MRPSLLRISFAAFSLALACAGPRMALAFDDKVAPLEPIWLFVGGGGNDVSDIDYRERPKLVIPKDMNLPEPQKNKKAANWPNDPDVARKRAAHAADRAPQQYEMNKNPLLSQKEIEGGKTQGGDHSTELCETRNSGSQDCSAPTPIDKLTRVFSLEEEPEGNASSIEPKRKFLTEPPSGYRRAMRPVAATSDVAPVERPDNADPKQYMRDQNARR